jgi:hypothetical protein
MRKTAIAAMALAGGSAFAAPALAHHSFAMFDTSKQVEISGTVKDFQYTNPHSWLIIMAPQPDGKVVEWGFESEGPSTLLQAGVKKSTLQPGDKVTAKAIPMRDGRPAGALISVTKADGTVVAFRKGAAAPKGLNLSDVAN